MTGPYIPLLVERANGLDGLAGAIGLVVGTAGLIGALASPVMGVVGDRVGFRRVLTAALGGGGIALLLMSATPSVPSLALVAGLNAGFAAATTAMVFGLLAVEVPAERRSATLNLVYLPLYLAGIVGPALGSVVVAAGLPSCSIWRAVLRGRRRRPSTSLTTCSFIAARALSGPRPSRSASTGSGRRHGTAHPQPGGGAVPGGEPVLRTTRGTR